MRALVVGAGIGGLAATGALRRAGHQVEVFERASELRGVGAGLTLFPNAMRALRHLGLAEAVIAAGAVENTGCVWSSSGRTLARGGVDLVQLYGEPAVGIHRGEFQRIPLQAAGEVRLGRLPPHHRVETIGSDQDVALMLGDAAHPTAPGRGQGACSALEDAALAVALQGAPDGAAGLRRYELRRTPRTARIVRQSRSALAAAQWANPLAVGLRGLLLRLPPAMVARRQGWLFSYDAAAAA